MGIRKREKKKKILIIDDSALMRRLMSDIIESDEHLCVSNVAKNGLEGLEMLDKNADYDLILLDINMPRMDGVSFLKEMVKRNIQCQVLVVSSIASKSAEETIQALVLGAFDFVKKPDRYIGAQNNNFKRVLLEKVNVAVQVKPIVMGDTDYDKLREEVQTSKPPLQKPVYGRDKRTGGTLVFIATSTGGPKALQRVIPQFPEGFPYPIVVVQHMPEGFTASLANRLDDMSRIPVKETQDGEVLQKGTVYIAKGGHQCHLLQTGNEEYCLAVKKEPNRNGLRPCADVFLESLAETGLKKIVCAVLTGMGDDATRGIAYLKKYKEASVIAQDEKTSVVYGMPRAITVAGMVDEVKALEEITDAIIKKAGE